MAAKIYRMIEIQVVRNIMIDLLSYTKKISEKIMFYDTFVDLTNENHLLNPFYKVQEVTVVWVENPNFD